MRSAVTIVVFAASTAFAQAQGAEPIVGQWRAETGNIVKVSACGGSYCATIVTGEHKGKRIGQLSGSGGQYRGTVTDPSSGKTYNGSAAISGGGASLKLTGCALKIFCKSQTWSRV
ncbi:DUF2147 domain-containing protein [Fulvimarina endophytica]|uniref:DUF2147 domain-containing protein n=1 Tax=Fulvimarina endophytica TaxID=2293836 RepID=A0A371XBE4_9HYPH|nr:DUF2147 domain-containing protein [Fulvimarina endophytica]